MRPKLRSIKVAIVKYMVTVTTSLIMVANGPEAIAGSKLIFLKTNGNPVEIRTADIILRNIEIPTIKPKIGSCQPTRATAESKPPHTNAKTAAIASSLKRYFFRDI